MTFLFTCQGQSYLVHTEVGQGNAKVIVEPVQSPPPLPVPTHQLIHSRTHHDTHQ